MKDEVLLVFLTILVICMVCLNANIIGYSNYGKLYQVDEVALYEYMSGTGPEIFQGNEIPYSGNYHEPIRLEPVYRDMYIPTIYA